MLCTDIELCLCDDVVGDELLGVLVQHDRLTANLGVHDRLCEHRLIRLVVTVTSIAHLYFILADCIKVFLTPDAVHAWRRTASYGAARRGASVQLNAYTTTHPRCEGGDAWRREAGTPRDRHRHRH